MDPLLLLTLCPSTNATGQETIDEHCYEFHHADHVIGVSVMSTGEFLDWSIDSTLYDSGSQGGPELASSWGSGFAGRNQQSYYKSVESYAKLLFRVLLGSADPVVFFLLFFRNTFVKENVEIEFGYNGAENVKP
ncbi:hypothetical protein CDAR_210031 [Caerostris darwini]|uniref:Uncharacterized protein n=1 Tax=Caerostris darwini TaxID=1538125 RepID=A0AAV4S866_9ARAC|nr:hypothetical protein CDAR_210031 [Caerostris darwini]